MTEAEWLASCDPEAMLPAVVNGPLRLEWPDSARTKRKRVLFWAACCRLLWPLIVADATCRRAVELLEAEVDAAPVEESEQVWEYVNELSRHPPDGTPIHQMLVADLLLAAGSPPSAVGYLLRSFDDWGDVTGRAAQVATIMRDIVGNPFRPVRADPRWLTSDVLALAASIYAERAFDRLPILADALQDAGCENADVLGHCRDPQLTHVRGCWVVDLVLGKE